ncbi:MAG: SDR family oxidoreductase [Gammaproteobacteria bacterium]
MTRKTAESLHIIVTGATEGIGREIALQLARQGAVLTLAARNEERLRVIVKECKQLGADAEGVVTDVANQSQCNSLIETAVAQNGRIDGLINNAGITMWTEFEQLKSLDVLEQVMRVNYLGAAYLTHAALPHLRESRGRLVVISSLAGLTGVPTRSGYAASKHAVNGFFDSLRIELIGSGVSVTIVAPDFVRSKIHERALTADGSELGTSPLANRKIMTAEECALQSIDAMLKRQRLRVMTPRGTVVRFLRILVPGFVDKLAHKAIYGK